MVIVGLTTRRESRIKDNEISSEDAYDISGRNHRELKTQYFVYVAVF